MHSSQPRPQQQIHTVIWVAGDQDISISSHDDAADSWVAVRVGQVLTYAIGLTAPQSINRIWTEAEQRAAHLLPPATPVRPQPAGPGIVVRLRGEQTTGGLRDRNFPYDGRANSGHILVGGILWRPVDRAALTGIADAWRRAAQIADALTGR